MQLLARDDDPRFSRHQPGVHMQPAVPDVVVMHAAAKRTSAVLDHPHAASLGAVIFDRLLKRDDAVGNAAHLQVHAGCGAVVQQHHGARTAGKKLFQRQDLSTVSQRAVGQQLEF